VQELKKVAWRLRIEEAKPQLGCNAIEEEEE
jgi:hypothetical protein